MRDVGLLYESKRARCLDFGQGLQGGPALRLGSAMPIPYTFPLLLCSAPGSSRLSVRELKMVVHDRVCHQDVLNLRQITRLQFDFFAHCHRELHTIQIRKNPPKTYAMLRYSQSATRSTSPPEVSASSSCSIVPCVVVTLCGCSAPVLTAPAFPWGWMLRSTPYNA